MYKDILTQISLSPNEAVVYEYLLKNGESAAGQIIKNTPLKRGVIYNALDELINKSLSVKKSKNQIALFSPNHPDKLREYVDSREKEIAKAKNSLEANLPALISDFNLVSGKPGVRYFEGLKGVKKVLWDSLTTKGEILTYGNMEAIVTYIDKMNNKYVAERDRLGIKKRAIVLDSPFTREHLKNYHRQTTDMRFINHKKYNFSPIVEIYDNKVSYVTLTDDIKIGVIIEDKNINQLHKSLFEFTWKRAKTFDQLNDLSKAQ